jgi:hypothetical protein
MIFGHKELKSFSKFENGRLVNYRYSITYNQYGQETSRTEPEAISSIGWKDESPFIQQDLDCILQ